MNKCRSSSWLVHLSCAVLAAGCGAIGIDLDARLDRARQAHESGDLAAAVVDLKVILQQAPENLEARLLLGDASLRLGDPATAEKEFARAVAIIAGQGAATEAASVEEERLQRARLGLAMSQAALQNFAAAGETAAAILEARPDDLFVHMLVVQSAYALGQDDKAREHLQVVLQARPDEPLANMLLGLVSIRQGRSEEGERLLEKTLSLRPDDNAVRLTLARVQMVLGKPVESLETLIPVLEQAPDSPVLVQLFESIDFSDAAVAGRALDVADTLAASSPESFVPYLIRARESFVNRDFQSAADFYDRAAAAGGGRFAVLGSFLSHRADGALQEGTRQLEAWIDDHPDDVVVRNVLATIHLGGGEQAAAAEQYERILDAGAGDPTVLNNLAWLYSEMGDPRAVSLAREAHRLAPQNGAITDTLGWLLVQQGDHAEGILLLRQAVTQAPQLPEIRQHLASALSASGQEEEAARVLAEIVAPPPAAMPPAQLE